MPSGVGSWSAPQPTPVFAVHANLVYNPTSKRWKVMMFQGGEEHNSPPTGPADLRKSALWDPVSNTFTEQAFALTGPTDNADPFCAHQVQLGDGRILVAGGALYGGPHARGTTATWVFDPVAETWSRTGDMTHGRWYPTTVALPDGRVLVASGRSATGSVVPQMEIYDPASGTWSVLPSSADKALSIYPSLHLVPAGLHTGKILYTGTRWSGGSATWAAPDTALLDLGTNSWANLATHLVRNRTEGYAVLLPPAQCARVLVLGGGATASDADPDSAEMLDLLEGTPQWRSVQDMHHLRTNVNGVLLPNGTVFVLGGHDTFKWDAQTGGDHHVYECEIYDPASKGWIRAADMSQPRQYHSVAVLLPDGRVFSAGGVNGALGDVMTMEIYSPPYMAEPQRPVITNAPAQVAYGQAFTVDTPHSAGVERVVFVRPGAVTHHTDSEQRLVHLGIVARNPGSIDLVAPGNPSLAPPGYYMLFLVGGCGTPSEAVFIRIGQPAKPIKEGKDWKDKEWKDKPEKEKLEKAEKNEKLEVPEKPFKEKPFKDKPEKEIYEGPDYRIPDWIQRQAGTMQHFIGPDLRPDLTKGALTHEPDVGKQAKELRPMPTAKAKQAKAKASPTDSAIPRGVASPNPARPKRAPPKAEAGAKVDTKVKGAAGRAPPPKARSPKK